MEKENMFETNFIPPKTWAFMIKTADENNLSTKEVQRIFLNKVASDLGFKCEHRRMGSADKDRNRPYCKDCWTRFKRVTERVYNFETKKWANKDKFEPLETFLDIYYIEEQNKKVLNSQGQGQVKLEERKVFI